MVQVVETDTINVDIVSAKGEYPALSCGICAGIKMEKLFEVYLVCHHIKAGTVRFKVGLKTISPDDTTETVSIHVTSCHKALLKKYRLARPIGQHADPHCTRRGHQGRGCEKFKAESRDRG